jgi:hypothetical protein
MLRVTSRRADGFARRPAARGSLRYAVVYRHAGTRLGRSRLSVARVEGPWWHRFMDDRDLLGAKLLLLAALLVLTALLERVV